MEQTDTRPERRQYSRVSVALRVRLDRWPEDPVVWSQTVNLSLAGARVRSPGGLDVGEAVLATLAVPGRIFTTFADVLDSLVVVDHSQAEVRLHFWPMSPPRRDGLARLLATVAQ